MVSKYMYKSPTKAKSHFEKRTFWPGGLAYEVYLREISWNQLGASTPKLKRQSASFCVRGESVAYLA